MLSALSFLDMLLQFRTGYVDKNSKIVIDPKKVATGKVAGWGGWFVATPNICSYSRVEVLNPLAIKTSY